MQLKPFQEQVVGETNQRWSQGDHNVAIISATGSGKTVMFTHIMSQLNEPSIAIAHRKELVSQMSLTLARRGIRHNIIASRETIKICIKLHMVHLGASFYNPKATVYASSVDTLIRRDPDDVMFKAIRLWVMDEAHHLLRDNKWGKAVAMFPNARGLCLTATPRRADGRGLGRHAHGLIDSMVLAPTMRELINQGDLCDYKIYAPTTHIDLVNVAISAGGDFSPIPLADAMQHSSIIGDVVRSYQQFATGKRGITFAVDIAAAEAIAEAYRAAGVPALAVSSETPDFERDDAKRKLEAGALLQLVNVDLFGEGFDLPAIEVVSFARPTQSYSLFVQQFGRALRTMLGKTHGIIIDHVGNVMRHGLPDGYVEWTLDARESSGRSSTKAIILTKVCPECLFVYERFIGPVCPDCGHNNLPTIRTIDTVDGVLAELSPEILAKMRNDMDKPVTYPYNADQLIIRSIDKRHRERQEALGQLRDAMNLWGGYVVASGDTLDQAQRRFYIMFGIDVGTAQTLQRADMIKLMEKVDNDRNRRIEHHADRS